MAKKIFPDDPKDDNKEKIFNQESIRNIFNDLSVHFKNASDSVRNFVEKINTSIKGIRPTESQKEGVSYREPIRLSTSREEKEAQGQTIPSPPGSKAFGLTRILTAGDLDELRENMIMGARRTILSTKIKLEEPELKAAESVGRLDLFRTMFSPTGVISQGALMALMFPMQMSLFGQIRRPIDTFNDSANKIFDAFKGFLPFEEVSSKIIDIFKTSPLTRYENIMITRQMLKSSLGGEVSADEAVNVAMRMAKEFPMKFDEILQSFRSLSVYPTVKPLLTDKKFQDDLLKAVSGLSVINPMQGVGGALFSIVEALSGSQRSMQFRFNISSDLIEAMSGIRKEEMVSDPVKLVAGLRTFIEKAVGLEALEASKYTLTKQIDNIDDAFNILVNSVMESSKVYPAMTKGVLALQSAIGGIGENKPLMIMVEKFFSPIVDTMYNAIGEFAGIPGVLAKGLPFKTLAEYIEKDFARLSPEDMRKRFAKFIQGFAESFSKFTESSEFKEINRSIRQILAPVMKVGAEVMGNMMVETFRSAAGVLLSDPSIMLKMGLSTMTMGVPLFAGLVAARKTAEAAINRISKSSELFISHEVGEETETKKGKETRTKKGKETKIEEEEEAKTSKDKETKTKEGPESKGPHKETQETKPSPPDEKKPSTQSSLFFSNLRQRFGKYFRLDDLFYGLAIGSYLTPYITDTLNEVLGTKLSTEGKQENLLIPAASLVIPAAFRYASEKLPSGKFFGKSSFMKGIGTLGALVTAYNVYSALKPNKEIEYKGFKDLGIPTEFSDTKYENIYNQVVNEYKKAKMNERFLEGGITIGATALGAIIGSIFPGIGTMAGLAIGSVIGTAFNPLIKSVINSIAGINPEEIETKQKNVGELLGRFGIVKELKDVRESLLNSGVSETSEVIQKLNKKIKDEILRTEKALEITQIEPSLNHMILPEGSTVVNKSYSNEIKNNIINSVNNLKNGVGSIAELEGYIIGLSKRTDLGDVLESWGKDLGNGFYQAVNTIRTYGSKIGVSKEVVNASEEIQKKIPESVKEVIKNNPFDFKIIQNYINENLEGLGKVFSKENFNILNSLPVQGKTFREFQSKFNEMRREFESLSSGEIPQTPEGIYKYIEALTKLNNYVKQFEPAVAAENLNTVLSSAGLYVDVKEYSDQMNKALSQQVMSINTLPEGIREEEMKKKYGLLMEAEKGFAAVEQSQFLQNAPLVRALGNYGFSPESFVAMAPFGKKAELMGAFEKEMDKVLSSDRYSSLQKLKILETFKGGISYEKYLETYYNIQDQISADKILNENTIQSILGGRGPSSDINNLSDSAKRASDSLNELANSANNLRNNMNKESILPGQLQNINEGKEVNQPRNLKEIKNVESEIKQSVEAINTKWETGISSKLTTLIPREWDEEAEKLSDIKDKLIESANKGTKFQFSEFKREDVKGTWILGAGSKFAIVRGAEIIPQREYVEEKIQNFIQTNVQQPINQRIDVKISKEESQQQQLQRNIPVETGSRIVPISGTTLGSGEKIIHVIETPGSTNTTSY